MRILTILLALLALSACAAKAPPAEAVMRPVKGSATAGLITFTQVGENVRIKAHITGLTPGAHGFHIHEKGDCDATGMNAGRHFNPTNQRHGDPAKPAHHAGDLPMLVAGAAGSAKFEAVMGGISLGPGPANILNRAVVIHAGPDDYTTQPSGNSGPAVACGVIHAR